MKKLCLLILIFACKINSPPLLKFIYPFSSPSSTSPLKVSFEYTLNEYILKVNQNYSIKPKTFLNVNSCSISETIGNGLIFNTETCEISGATSSFFAKKTFTITAKNSSDSVIREISLYSDFTPDFVYPNPRKTFYINLLAPRQTPIVTGQITEFSVSPSLPSGLSIHATTGEISGTPNGITSMETDYFITAKSLIGSVTKKISIRIGNNIATKVYGQFGNFNVDTVNNGGVSANSLARPEAGCFDSSNGLYIVDRDNNRVLYFNDGSTTATKVYGQAGSFFSNAAGLSSSSFNLPLDCAVDSNNDLYISDYHNNRILVFQNGSTTATRVYGQGGDFSTNTAGTSASNLTNPRGLAIDRDNNLYLTEHTGGNRSLFFPAGNTIATRVYGQFGNFNTNTANNSGVSANSMSQANNIFIDKNNNLYIADYGNNRALEFPNNNTTAVKVYGQFGDFTNNSSNNGGVSANSLSGPWSVVRNEDTGVFISDAGNNRILFYHSGSTTASNIFGQGNFSTNASQTTATGISFGLKIILDKTGALCIFEYSNSRVICY